MRCRHGDAISGALDAWASDDDSAAGSDSGSSNSSSSSSSSNGSNGSNGGNGGSNDSSGSSRGGGASGAGRGAAGSNNAAGAGGGAGGGINGDGSSLLAAAAGALLRDLGFSGAAASLESQLLQQQEARSPTPPPPRRPPPSSAPTGTGPQPQSRRSPRPGPQPAGSGAAAERGEKEQQQSQQSQQQSSGYPGFGAGARLLGGSDLGEIFEGVGTAGLAAVRLQVEGVLRRAAITTAGGQPAAQPYDAKGGSAGPRSASASASDSGGGGGGGSGGDRGGAAVDLSVEELAGLFAAVHRPSVQNGAAGAPGSAAAAKQWLQGKQRPAARDSGPSPSTDPFSIGEIASRSGQAAKADGGLLVDIAAEIQRLLQL